MNRACLFLHEYFFKKSMEHKKESSTKMLVFPYYRLMYPQCG